MIKALFAASSCSLLVGLAASLLLPVGLVIWLAGRQRKKPPLHPMPR